MSTIEQTSELENPKEAAPKQRTTEDVLNCVMWESAKREIYIAALKHTSINPQPSLRSELEQHMIALPEAKTMHQAPGTLIDALVKCGALGEEVPDPVFDEDTQEYFVDRSRASYTLTATGQEALAKLSTSERTRSLFESEPQFKDSYMSLLGFCSEQARTRLEIDELLDDVCAAQPNSASVTRYGIYASYFTDKLQASGALTWDDGWTTTEDGKAILEVFQ